MKLGVWYKLLIQFYLVSFVQDGGHDGCFALTKKLVRIEETVCVVAAPLRNRRKKELSRKKHHVEQGVNEEMLEKCVTKFATRFFFWMADQLSACAVEHSGVM